jgi:hypothetical protein
MYIAYVCGIEGHDQGGGFEDSKGRGEANIMQDGTVNLQHGTVVDGDSYPCFQGHHPQQGFLSLETDKPPYV